MSSPPGRAQLSSCSEPQVSQFIRKHVASSLLVSDTSTELSYILPSEAAKKGAFERLFQVWKQGGVQVGLEKLGEARYTGGRTGASGGAGIVEVQGWWKGGAGGGAGQVEGRG